MTTNALQMLAPNAETHLQPIAQLAADVFSSGNYVEQFAQNYIGNSHYDWDRARVVLDGEKMIHHWGVWGYSMRLETVQFKVAGIGAVVTLEPYRKQMLMHQAAQASFEAMQQAGYDLSILRGRHYAKMGYARAWNYVTYRLKLEELPHLEAPAPYQPLRAEQTESMDTFYNQTHADFTGTAIRPTYRQRHPSDIGVYAWFDPAGQLAGYIRAMPAEDAPKLLQCLEAAGDPRQCLAVLGDVFKNGDYDSLCCFTLPHAHALLQLLRKGACIVEDRYFDVSGWRVRIINLPRCLQKLAPRLEERLAHSEFAGWQGSLHLDAGEQQANVHIEGGKIAIGAGEATQHSLCGGAAIARLLIGSDEPDEIIRQADMTSSGLARPLAQVLFPNLHPMLSHWDEI